MKEGSKSFDTVEAEISWLKDSLARLKAEKEEAHNAALLYRGLFESSNEAILFLDKGLRLLAFNKVAAYFVSQGFEKPLKVGESFEHYLDEKEKQMLSYAIEKNESGEIITNEVKTKNNNWLKYKISPILDHEKKFVGSAVSVNDITSKRATEQLLHLIEFSVENANDAMFWIGKEGNIIKVNKSACNLLGYKEEELITKSVFDIDVALSKDMWFAHWQLLKDRKHMSFESTHLTSNGTKIPTSNKLNYLEFEGQEMNFVIATDITDVKKAERQAKENDELYNEIIQNAPEATIIFDMDSQLIVDCNKAVTCMFNISYDELIGMDVNKLSAPYQPGGIASADKGPDYLERIINGEKFFFEWKFKNAEGKEFLVDIRITQFHYKGRLLGRSSLVDITERKNYEFRLFESEQRYKSLFEQNPEGICSVDEDGKFINVNEAFARINETTKEELIGRSFKPMVAPEYIPLTREYFDKVNKGIGDTFEMEIFTQKGNRRTLRITGIPIIIEDKLKGVYAIARDITEEKNFNTKLKLAAQQLRNIYESISDSFFSLDNDWNIVVVNQEYEKMVNLHRSQLIGKNFWDIIPSAKGEDWNQYFFEAARTKKSVSYEVCYEPIWFGVSLYPSEDGLSVHIRNITEKKNSEKRIEESLKEKEVLLAEVHHRVKNNLAIVSSLLQLQSYNISDENVKIAIQESRSRIQSIALVHQQLYNTDSFAKISMQSYITELVEKLSLTYKIKVPVELYIEADNVELDITRAIPCGLILNELISNIYKHAFGGLTKGNIWIKFKEQEGKLELLVKDDGRGFKVENLDDSASMGMSLVRMLTEQLGGILKIENDCGVKVQIIF